MGIASGQDTEPRLATANGTGTLKVGSETFKINSVIVKLFADKKAEITLVADITVFLEGTWSTADPQQGIDLRISGSGSAGGLEATGKIVLSGDGKSVSRLKMKGIARLSKRNVEANFQGR